MVKKFDLAVIGTGSAGAKVANACRKKGWKVAVIDKSTFGGTCSQRGCDPKKILIGAAEIIDRINLMQGKGIKRGFAAIDWKELMQFKRAYTEVVPVNSEKNFKSNGIETYHGTAKFTGKLSIEVNGDELQFEKILIASGQRPADLIIERKEHVITSDIFLNLDKMPERVVFIGGGYIAFEFATISSRTGAKVQILQSGERPLTGFDPDLVQMLLKGSADEGIKTEVNARVIKVERKNNLYIVHANVNGENKLFETDLVVHAAGRVPDIDELELGAAGIDFNKRGIIVNEYFQSISNPNVYAAGDAADANGALPLTPLAGRAGSIVIHNLIEGNSAKGDFDVVPTVVFTLPPLASVGISESDALKQKLKFRKNFQDTTAWFSSKRIGLKYSGFKVLIEEDSEKILGAHILGHNAEEIINLFSFTMKMKLTTLDLKNTIYTYPTSSSDIIYMI